MGQINEPRLSAPEKLNATHDTSGFACGEPSLDIWLQQRALRNEKTGASRTYVLCADHRIAGYYALATGTITHTSAPGRIKRNMPDPVPVIIIGRLAIALKFQGHGIGTALLRDAVLRIIQASEIAGVRAILVHAISNRAKSFYEKHGFTPSPTDPMTLLITIQDAKASLIATRLS